MRIGALASKVLAAVWLVALLAGPARAQVLSSDIQRLIDQGKLGHARVGISLRDLGTGESIADVDADQRLIPASNMKLLTSGAALLTLGDDYQFRTEVLVEGDRVILRGAGDPALGDPEVLSAMRPRLTDEDILAMWVGEIQKAGITKVRSIVVDDRVFDREALHPSWPAENYLRSWSAQVSGFNYHANLLRVYMTPRRDTPGSPPSVKLQPEAPWITTLNRARSVPQGKNTIRLSRDFATGVDNRLSLAGEIGTTLEESITYDSPGLFAGMLLADRLARAGIQADLRGVRLVEASETLGGRTVAVVATPISVVLDRCNTHSENLYAECLLKKMGNAVTREPGSWRNGTSVLRMRLAQDLDPDAAAGTVVADGSGLSRENAVSPSVMTRWLCFMHRSKVREAYIQSLAVPGEDGTLRQRFRGSKLGSRVHAKSGFINGVRTLSGYVLTPDGSDGVAFSVLVNDITTGDQTTASKELHEKVVELADKHLSRRRDAAEPRKGG